MPNVLDKNKDIEEDLKQIGLEQNESVVYLSLLKLGEVGASKIVRDTGLHGQSVYDALYKLEEKNLVRFNLVKGRKRFLAQSPSILINLLEKQKEVASQIVDKIEKRFSVIDTEQIEIIKGRESFVINEFKNLEDTADDSELLILGGLGDSFIKNMDNKINSYDYNRNKRNIAVRYIGSDEQKPFLTSTGSQRSLFKYKFLPNVFSGITNITIFKNKVVNIYLFDETVTVISIRNKQIAESYTSFFESLWELGKF